MFSKHTYVFYCIVKDSQLIAVLLWFQTSLGNMTIYAVIEKLDIFQTILTKARLSLSFCSYLMYLLSGDKTRQHQNSRDIL